MFSAQACPQRDCPRCERLVAYRLQARERAPEWFNAPVPPFGVTLDLASPKLLSVVATDAAGDGQLSSGVPNALSGVPVWVRELPPEVCGGRA